MTAAPALSSSALTDSAGKRFFVVSADCHVVEPADLWETRIDRQYRDRLTRTTVDERGRKWVQREGHRPSRLVDTAAFEGEDQERARGGSRDPEVRRHDHARDGIDAEVIYPTAGLMMWSSPDAVFQQAQCRVWNDWAHEVFAAHRERTAPAAAIAPRDVEGAVAEVQRVAKLGFRHVLLPVQPGPDDDGRALGYNEARFDPIWAALQDAGLPISFHVGTGRDPRVATGRGGAVINYVVHALATGIEPVTQMCASGVLEQFPKLRFATVEAGSGWLAWTLWAMDEAYKKHHMWVSPKLPMLPSDYFRRQGHASFQDDPIGIETRKWIGPDRLMWGNDYPHQEGTWPHSDEAISRTMGHLPDDERRHILGGTAAALYGFTMPK